MTAGCSKNTSSDKEDRTEAAKSIASETETESVSETEEETEAIDEETMDFIKYNIYVEMNNYMIRQVESQVPIEDSGRKYLGGIIHIEEVLSDLIDQYNSVFAE